MKTLKFRCTLLSDIVLNASAATEGEQTSIDYIPGNSFLGIVAAGYKDYSTSEQLALFHSGKVRFGDAHIAAEGDSMRSLHVPAVFFYPKMKSPSEECYAWHGYSREEDKRLHGEPMQLKQCRKGYYVFNDATARLLNVEKSFSIKSAYDREKRRTSDSQMFGYESLGKGQSFFFEVETDIDELAEKIERALVGRHRIGRSRTAQYGLVNIERADYNDYPSMPGTIPTKNGPRVAVYADSRLVFLDSDGLPVFRPTAEQLGLQGEVDWEMSQVRTFQYAPWNGKRQARDTDRCGIEKGSVLFVNITRPMSDSLPNYVGSYNNEGFGRVIYNPSFLLSAGENGKVSFKFEDTTKTKVDSNLDVSSHLLSDSPLLTYLVGKKRQQEAEEEIMKRVNEFVRDNGRRFDNSSFASQWGTIRKIAMAYTTKQQINSALFDENGYLVHGIAEDKWKKRQRRDTLQKFIEGFKTDDYVQQAVINLASEMAKICSRNEKN